MKRLFFTAIKSALFRAVGPKRSLPVYRVNRLEVSKPLAVHDQNFYHGFNTVPDLRLNQLDFKRNDLNVYDMSLIDDFRAVIEPIKLGPQVIELETIQTHAIHRVAVRGVLESIDTTVSEEFSMGELDLLNTTHSSYVFSESSE